MSHIEHSVTGLKYVMCDWSRCWYCNINRNIYYKNKFSGYNHNLSRRCYIFKAITIIETMRVSNSAGQFNKLIFKNEFDKMQNGLRIINCNASDENGIS